VDKRNRFEPLNDQEARPETPFPYVVYGRNEVVNRMHSTGQATVMQEIMYEDVPIDFHVHAKPVGSRDGREVVIELIRLIKAAFDPGTPLFDLSPDRHECTLAGGDWIIRQSDQEWMGLVSYTIRMESTYNRGLTELPELP